MTAYSEGPQRAHPPHAGEVHRRNPTCHRPAPDFLILYQGPDWIDPQHHSCDGIPQFVDEQVSPGKK